MNFKFEIFLIMGEMAIQNINNTIDLLSLSKSNKQNIANAICQCFNIFPKEIFVEDLLNCFLMLISKDKLYLNKIIENTICFKDFINIVNKNIDYFKKISFTISTRNFIREDFGEAKEIIPKIIKILSECHQSCLDSDSIIEKYSNFSDYLSHDNKLILYHLIKKNNDIIKIQLGKSMMMNDAQNNEEIIHNIKECIAWNFPEIYPIVIDSFNKLNFQIMNLDFINDFVVVFKQFHFFETSNLTNRKIENTIFFFYAF